ncbi:MAG: hypothetical protein OHK0032_06840 [Thermodesulfovibrionales bacterium]
MIINTYVVITLFIALLTVFLSIMLGVASLNIYRRWGDVRHVEERIAIENRSYLLLNIAVAILFVRLLSWPFFYATLQSFVSDVPGAMCIFGVTRVKPYLSGIVQIFKPAVSFAIGGWMLLNSLDRKTETAPLFKRKFLFLFIVSILIFADSSLDLIYLTGFKVANPVACCTTLFDLPERMTAAVSVSILGEGYERYLLPMYYLSSLSFIAFQSFSYYRLRPDQPLLIPITGVAIASVNAAVTIFAMFEVIAPRIMHLPYHHCIYCMWQYVPTSILMTALFIIGTFSPGWALILDIAGRHEETATALEGYLKNLSLLGIAGIGGSAMIATVYLLL